MGAALRPNGLENGGFVRGGRRLPVLSQPTARRVFRPDYKDDDEGEPGPPPAEAHIRRQVSIGPTSAQEGRKLSRSNEIKGEAKRCRDNRYAAHPLLPLFTR